MIEVHPFGNFVPPKTKYLMLGSFTTKPDKSYKWFYANGRNHFWPIMEVVYNLQLRTKVEQQGLFVKLQMALADMILSCERRKNSSLDVNLFNISYNAESIKRIIKEKRVVEVYFTSRFAETLFRKCFKDAGIQFPQTEFITLPSPSPRYAVMRKQDKIARYKELLPKI